MVDTSRSEPMSTVIQRIAKQAIDYPDMTFTTLAHHITVELLHEAYCRTRKDGAPGIDQITSSQYGQNLEANLSDLHERLRTGRYKAPPVERVYIDKEDGRKRPIGMPTFEDKIVQRAVVMLISPVYEPLFYDFSYGFRPGRSAHQAIVELRERCMNEGIGWIVDADVKGYFDSIDHGYLREFLKTRVNDGGIIRLVGKWLNAGVMEEGRWQAVDAGTPQGGVISPLLSNIFLHYVLDDWFEREVRPRMKGRCFLIRYADDFVIGCQQKEDADRILDVLPKRFNRFKLTIHPEKTRLVNFQRPGFEQESGKGKGTFTFLGFTFYWSKSRKGYWVIKKKTAKSRIKRFSRSVGQWLRNNCHVPVLDQCRKVSQKLRGYYQYFGVRGNIKALQTVYYEVLKTWRYWLDRRSRRGRLNWDKFLSTLKKHSLPKPRIIHNF